MNFTQEGIQEGIIQQKYLDLDGEIWECQGHHIPSSTQKAKDCARPGVRHATYDQLEGAEGGVVWMLNGIGSLHI